MKGCVAPPRRPSDRSVWHILIILVLLSIPAFAQTQQVLGNSQILNLLDTNNVGMAEAFPVTARSSGHVNSLSLFLDGSNTATTISVGLYTSYHGHPSILLRQAVLTQPVAGRWNSVQISPVQVTQWKRYWLAVLGLNGQIEFRDSNSSWWCRSETSYQTALTSLPARWWTGSQYPSCLISMFGSGGVSSTVSVSLSPQTAYLQPAQQTQFTASVSGTIDTAVTWKTSGGTVTSSGLYTAPSLSGTYTVTATSSADSSKSSSATIKVSQPTQVSISVSPGTATIRTGGQQQFTASVLGTSNTSVAWKATGGTVTTTGLYTAPSTAGTYTVTATTAADSTKSASATITVSQPAQVSISVSPYTANIQTGGQQQFTASVLGTSNTGVGWKANGGTVTTTGLYTAPSTAGTYTVTATSAADSTKSASATITVSQPAQVWISVSPGSASIQTAGQQQFTASVLGTSNTGVAWKANGGMVTTTGLYTAPSTAGTYTVTATSAADSTKSASATITVSQPTQISISVSPGTASLQTGAQQQFTAMISGTSNTAVTWTASSGIITTSGLYTAPTTTGTYTVMAVSAANSSRSASATVSVSAPQPVSISISPTSLAMPQKWQQQFSAIVSGSTSTGVAWTVSKGTGTITQSGLYTAPQAVETDIVTATSQADSTKSASATITVAAPHTVALTWTPSASTGVTYDVYRGTVTGGPYILLISGVTGNSYIDKNVQSGSTYYYVTTAAASGGQSSYSNEVLAVIPMP
jgi:hypothetical protein